MATLLLNVLFVISEPYGSTVPTRWSTIVKCVYIHSVESQDSFKIFLYCHILMHKLKIKNETWFLLNQQFHINKKKMKVNLTKKNKPQKTSVIIINQQYQGNGK